MLIGNEEFRDGFRLQKHDAQNSECRDLAKSYFRCRMDNNLMERSEWKLLGYGDLPQEESSDR